MSATAEGSGGRSEAGTSGRNRSASIRKSKRARSLGADKCLEMLVAGIGFEPTIPHCGTMSPTETTCDPDRFVKRMLFRPLSLEVATHCVERLDRKRAVQRTRVSRESADESSRDLAVDCAE